MRILHIFFMMVFTLCLASNQLYARSVFLPDSQDKSSIPFNKRISAPIAGASNYSDISCSTYGLYSAANRPENADCSFVGSFMEKDCYRCSCSSSYMYDTSNCPSPYVLSKQCLGKYQNCLCNSSTYPAITDDDCGNGYIRDISASCTN
ncbi:MAG: hypothetical protein IKL33_01580, partial [Alphaproteobacteria bacterium]|nr:hypothetical protein [Alphaproteobacteria bacterium]